MANCYICSGFIHNPDKKVVLKKTYHNQCWNRLDRKTKLKLESELTPSTLDLMSESFKGVRLL